MIRYVCFIALLLTLLYCGWSFAQAQQHHPVMDAIANKVIQKYQSSSCQQLLQQKMEPNKQRSPKEEEAVNLLRGNAELRAEFINRVAPPIANKMFECGMIP